MPTFKLTQQPGKKGASAFMGILAIWGILRLMTSLLAARFSAISPVTQLEMAMPAWPISKPVSLWLQRVLLDPWLRYDADWFLKILTQGYNRADGTTNFQPLYPWAAFPFAKAGISPMLSLMIVSSLCSLLMLYFFDRLARFELRPLAHRASTLLFILFPTAFILFAPYSESLFLLCAVLCLYWSIQRKWWLAGFAGGLAALTRQQGIFLFFPMAWDFWEASGCNLKGMVQNWKTGLALSLVPIGLFIWVAYRAFALHDLQPDFSSIHGMVYSLLISPGASKVVQTQTFTWPWKPLWTALQIAWKTPGQTTLPDLLTAGLFLILLVISWNKLRTSFRIYVAIITLVSFSYYTGPSIPYMGLPRHLLLAFPVFIGLAAAIRHSWQRQLLFGISALGFFTLTWLYVMNGWVP